MMRGMVDFRVQQGEEPSGFICTPNGTMVFPQDFMRMTDRADDKR